MPAITFWETISLLVPRTCTTVCWLDPMNRLIATLLGGRAHWQNQRYDYFIGWQSYARTTYPHITMFFKLREFWFLTCPYMNSRSNECLHIYQFLCIQPWLNLLWTSLRYHSIITQLVNVEVFWGRLVFCFLLCINFEVVVFSITHTHLCCIRQAEGGSCLMKLLSRCSWSN